MSLVVTVLVYCSGRGFQADPVAVATVGGAVCVAVALVGAAAAVTGATASGAATIAAVATGATISRAILRDIGFLPWPVRWPV
jgi:hypothetical protein